MKLSIIIPVYNEDKTLTKILEKVKKLNLDKEIIIIDDGSTDKTRKILNSINNPAIKILFHSKNQGKGTAVRTALKYISGDVIVIQDADLEYDPEIFCKMFSLLETENYEVIYGSRMMGNITGPKIWYYYFGNKLLSLITTILYFNKITDMETCYKMFRRKVIEDMHLKAKGFDFEPEITAKILKKGYTIKEIPINYNSRSFKEGKKIKVIDGFKALYYLIKYRITN